MRNTRWKVAIVLTALCLGTWAAPAGGQKRSGARRSAYDALDSGRLAGALRQMGMSELLEALAEELGSTGDTKRLQGLRVEVLIDQANATEDAARRDQLLVKAVDLMKELIKQADPQSPREVYDLLELRFTLARTLALDRGEIYALRLLYLQGGPEDRKVLRSLTEEAAKLLDELGRDVEGILMTWRPDPIRLVTLVPRVEIFEKKVQYWSAWVFFYRGMTLPDGKERTRLLQMAILNAEPFAAGSAESGVKFDARLLLGMANRELYKFGEAVKNLGMVIASNRPRDAVKIQARFEIARTHIDRGGREARSRNPAVARQAEATFKSAAQAVEEFRKKVSGMLGARGKVQVDMLTAMLQNYLHETWANCVSSKEQGAAHRQAAQKALLDFISMYADRPEVVRPFLEILAQKYRGRKDHKNLNSVVLLAKAMGALEARPKREKEAALLLKMILARKEKMSELVRPFALWYLALIMNDRRENMASAKLFLELARKHPRHGHARRAALNAVIIYSGIDAQRSKEGKSIGVNIRREYIQALEVLLGNPAWVSVGDAAKWYFDLGWQCRELAQVAENAGRTSEQVKWSEKAIPAFEKVPRNQDEFLRARYLSFELRVKIIALKELPAGPKRTKAEQLFGGLRQFSNLCKDARANVKGTGPDAEASKALLSKWGSRAAFWMPVIRYEQLGQKAEAINDLRTLPAKWPGTPVLQESAEFLIRKLVKRGEIPGAIKELQAFIDKYPEDAGRKLIRLVVLQIRKRVDKLRENADERQQYENYRKVYLKFARLLYEPEAGKPMKDKYAYAQMLAHALVENEMGAEALKLFEQLAAHDTKIREAKVGKINDECERARQMLQANSDDPIRTAKTAAETIALLAGHGVTGENSSIVQDLIRALAFLKNDKAKEPQDQRLAALVETLQEAYKDSRLPAIRRRSLPIDAANISGLARSHVVLGNYTKALEYYHEMLRGIDSGANKDLYWQTELAYCRVAVKAFADKPGAMGRLVTRIRQLRLKDSEMNFLSPKFGMVETVAKRLAGKGKPARPAPASMPASAPAAKSAAAATQPGS